MKPIKPINLATLCACALLMILASCSKKEEEDKAYLRISTEESSKKNSNDLKIFYGHPVNIGSGIIRSWVAKDKSGKPVAIGADLDEKAIFNLKDEHKIFLMDLPKDAKFAPFEHITLDWNPHGHEPDHIFTLPHFDLHFYMICEKKRAKIPLKLPPYMDRAPAAKYVPEAYVQGPGLEPAMGAHWVDVLSPEFNGGIFTKTFIYGSYKGDVIFYEPMFTVDYLKTKVNETIPIRQPKAFRANGYYPQNYSFNYDKSKKVFSVALTGLVYRKGE